MRETSLVARLLDPAASSSRPTREVSDGRVGGMTRVRSVGGADGRPAIGWACSSPCRSRGGRVQRETASQSNITTTSSRAGQGAERRRVDETGTDAVCPWLTRCHSAAPRVQVSPRGPRSSSAESVVNPIESTQPPPPAAAAAARPAATVDLTRTQSIIVVTTEGRADQTRVRLCQSSRLQLPDEQSACSYGCE